MAENELREAGTASQVVPDGRTGVASSFEKAPDLRTSEGPESRQQTADSKASPAEQTGQEKALVEALRAFVKHEAGTRGGSPTEKIGARQAIALLLLALDLGLTYSIFERWIQNPLPQQLLKVVPWLFGATAVGYADRVRQFMVDHARQLKWVAVLLALLVPLFASRLEVFSVPVQLDSNRAAVTRSPKPPEPKGNGLYILGSSFDAYPVTVEEPTEQATKDSASPYKFELGSWTILRGTIARVPLLGKLWPFELHLSPLYNVVRTHSKSPSWQSVVVEGRFQYGFFQPSVLSDLNCSPASPKQAGNKAINCSVRKEGGFGLPSGQYDFTVCQKPYKHWDVKPGSPLDIPMDELCQ